MSGNQKDEERVEVEPSEFAVTVETEEKDEPNAQDTSVEKETSPKEEPAPEEVETSVDEDPETVSQVKEETEKEVAQRVQKGVARAKEDLTQVATLLASNPEKMAELKESNPDLYARLERQLPDITKSSTQPEVTERDELQSMLTDLLDANEKEDMQAWANSHGIGDADYVSREALMKSRAKALLSNGLVPTWREAVETAGGMVFPNTKGAGVNSKKLESMASQGANPSNRTAKAEDEATNLEKAVMKVTGATKEEAMNVAEEMHAPLD